MLPDAETGLRLWPCACRNGQQVVSDFRLYKHGVYDSYDAKTKAPLCRSGPGTVNHAVVVVGYADTEDGVPFYIIRNSWGTSWGMEGYFWMVRGKNMCGVSDCASFPWVNKGDHQLEKTAGKAAATVPEDREVRLTGPSRKEAILSA